MKKELSMEARLLIAFALMGVVILVSQFVFKPAPAPVATKAGAQKAAQTPPAEAVQKPRTPATPPSAGAGKETAPKAPQKAEAAAQVQADKEETYTIDTNVFRVVFSNKGAVVKSWVLKDYKDHEGKPLELVNQRALGKVPAPFSIAFKGTAPTTDPNNALFKAERSPDGLGISFEFSDGHAQTKKTFHFEKASYLVGVSSEVTQNGVMLPHSLEWRGGFGDPSVVNPTAVQQALYFDQANQKLQKKQAKDAKDGPVSISGQFSFAGLEDSYFAAVFLPDTSKTSIEQTTYSDTVQNAQGKDELRVGTGVGGEGVNMFSLFVGPKDNDLLSRVNPKLSQLIDWGFFGVLAKPLFIALNWTADHLTQNYGWAIILVTVVINLVLFPLRISSMKSSKKMQALQPQIAAINEKYKNIPMRDPRQSEKNQEIMELYKKNNVNPVGGCLPMLIQLPFLWAFYKVLSVSIEMRGAHWLWATDLSQPDTFAGIHWLPILLVITQFLTQKMTPSPGMDPTQQKMMLFMPLMFGYMFYFASAGLVLYWLTGNIVGIGLQWILNRSMPAPQVTAPMPATKKRRS